MVDRTFATETTQFLAPYEVSQKNRTTAVVDALLPSPTTTAAAGLVTASGGSEQNIQHTFQAVVPPPAAPVRPNKLTSSLSNSDLGGGGKSGCFGSGTLIAAAGGVESNVDPPVRKAVANWNPFHDPQPFSQMTEDHIIDAEFEAIRHRGSQSSEFFF